MSILNKYQNFYFIGIGGIGMSALARFFHANGKNVLGYDKTPTKLTAQLGFEGIDISFEDVIDEKIIAFDKESTLVIGIDIGSTTQYARAFDWRGIELGKVFTFSNSREGFESFKAWMQHLQDKYRKSDVIVGIEPTGHYWFDLGAYLEDEGIFLVMVNPYAVKQTKELDDNSQSKNDSKDCLW